MRHFYTESQFLSQNMSERGNTEGQFESSSHRMNPLTGRWVRIGGRTETKLRRAEFLANQMAKQQVPQVLMQLPYPQQRKPPRRKPSHTHMDEVRQARKEKTVAHNFKRGAEREKSAPSLPSATTDKNNTLWTQNGF